MDVIYTLLVGLNLIVLFIVIPVGLIRPSLVVRWGEKRTRGRVLIYYGIGAVVLAGLKEPMTPDAVREEQEQARLVREMEEEASRLEQERQQEQARLEQERQQEQARLEQERQRQFVQAIDLHREFNENEVQAGNKYKGKLLRVAGFVDRVSKDVLGSGITVHLKADEYGFATVECQFSEEHAGELALLSSGQGVSIDGTCFGRTTGRTVYITECTIFKLK